MEKIKIGNQDFLYEINSIIPISTSVLKIQFSDAVPETFGDIILYTSGDIEATILTGYETVFRMEGNIVFLSNDGSVYKEQEESDTPELPDDPYTPTEEEILEYSRSTKKLEIASSCEKTIYNGVDVTLSDGNVEHFSLTEHDQLNLFGKQLQITSGQEEIEYHADGQSCRYYSVQDMNKIIQAAMQYVSYHTTYCNALNMWTVNATSVDEIQNIFYGADVPVDYQSDVLKAYLLNELG